MPYGLPPLSQAEIVTLGDWVSNGAPGPTEATLAARNTVPPEVQTQIRAWEAFLNGGPPRERLVARYLFEHLFIAHLHFMPDATSQRPMFFRLVRSRAPCEADTAVVTQGAVGDLSKTLFVLDYSLLEPLVYNLVVNYDVFGQRLVRALIALDGPSSQMCVGCSVAEQSRFGIPHLPE